MISDRPTKIKILFCDRVLRMRIHSAHTHMTHALYKPLKSHTTLFMPSHNSVSNNSDVHMSHDPLDNMDRQDHISNHSLQDDNYYPKIEA